jgi:hypothetical protein
MCSVYPPCRRGHIRPARDNLPDGLAIPPASTPLRDARSQAAAPVVPEYSSHMRRTWGRVSREPTSGINRPQAVRVTTVSVAAFAALILMHPGVSLTTWSQAVCCHRVRRGPPGSKFG